MFMSGKDLFMYRLNKVKEFMLMFAIVFVMALFMMFMAITF